MVAVVVQVGLTQMGQMVVLVEVGQVTAMIQAALEILHLQTRLKVMTGGTQPLWELVMVVVAVVVLSKLVLMELQILAVLAATELLLPSRV